MGGIARENKMEALAVGGTADHVHILLVLPSTISIAKAIQLIKDGSSKWVSDAFPALHSFAWQEGYGAFSISVSGIDDTVAYIKAQDQHHSSRLYQSAGPAS
jgi:REP element-mobilizing transposase RayT